MEKQNEFKVYVGDVDAQKNEVYLEGNDNIEAKFYPISPPCDIKFMLKKDGIPREGNATVRLNAFGGVCYLKFDSVAPAPNNGFGGYKKPWTPTRGPSQPFQKANNYQPKEEVDWDKIAVGKCKHAFLIEAFKMNMSLDKAELMANLWARASMRPVPEEKSIEQSFIDNEVKKVKSKKDNTEEKVDELMGDGIPEEDLGVF
jgi:hypothetical protein